MQNHRILFFVVIGALGPVYANPVSPERCTRIQKAAAGANYARSQAELPGKDQVWQFKPDGELAASGVADFGKKPGTTGRWQFQHEDGTCVLKVAWFAKKDHWLTYHLVDVTWAIVTLPKDERHIPDFADHTGGKFRFCGIENQCRPSVK